MSGIDNVIKVINEKNSFHEYPWLRSLYDKVIELKPKRIKEIGTGSGATTLVLAQAIYDLNNEGKVVTQDSQKRWSSHNIIESQFPHLHKLIDFNYNTHFELELKRDINIEDDFDLLYVDMANNYNSLKNLFTLLFLSGIDNKHIIFEGGCLQRDEIEIKNREQYITRLQNEFPYEILNNTFSCVSYYHLKQKLI
jgi:hypothetical protein